MLVKLWDSSGLIGQPAHFSADTLHNRIDIT